VPPLAPANVGLVGAFHESRSKKSRLEKAAPSQYRQAAREWFSTDRKRHKRGRKRGVSSPSPGASVVCAARPSTGVETGVEALQIPANSTLFVHLENAEVHIEEPPDRCYARRSPVPPRRSLPAAWSPQLS
jgi:hypothetical protein